jgi:hypothetical protein
VLLGAAARILPHEATAANSSGFESAAGLWRAVLDHDLPAEAGHLRGAGRFAYARAWTTRCGWR